MFKDYLMERENKVYVEYDYGFAIYTIEDSYIYMSDVYIKPDERNKGLHNKVADDIVKIGKDNNCTYIVTTAALEDKNLQRSKKIIIDYGFVPLKINNGLIWYIKEI